MHSIHSLYLVDEIGRQKEDDLGTVIVSPLASLVWPLAAIEGHQQRLTRAVVKLLKLVQNDHAKSKTSITVTQEVRFQTYCLSFLAM